MIDSWMQTYTGKCYDYEGPDPSQICIEDIAHALSQINRFCGHTCWPYSVAQHSVLCYEHACKLEDMPTLYARLLVLIHDAHEAYVGDMISPLKRHVSGYAAIERTAQQAVLAGLDIPVPDQDVLDIVNRVDLELLATEVRDLAKQSPTDWGLPYQPIAHTEIRLWDPGYAKHRFLAAYRYLTGSLSAREVY